MADEEELPPDTPKGLTILSVEAVRWANPEHTAINMSVAFEEFQSFEAKTNYTATANDNTVHGLELWTKANAGDYGAIAEYVAPPPVVPDSVSARQFKLQLLASGLLDQVEGWVAAQDQAVQIAYAESGTFVRSEPMMQTGFAALGFTSEQIDAFYVAATAL